MMVFLQYVSSVVFKKFLYIFSPVVLGAVVSDSLTSTAALTGTESLLCCAVLGSRVVARELVTLVVGPHIAC